MSVRIYGINHVAIEVDDLEKAKMFYKDVFALELQNSGERRASFKAGEHQFFVLAEVKPRKPESDAHFGFIVRDENQLAQVRDKVTKKYGLQLIEGFRCAFRDPFGNRMDVVDLHDESLVWLLPYQEVQEAGIHFAVENS